MYTGYFTLDSPLYLTDFHIVTNSVCVNFYFLAIPQFVICWVFCSVCIIGKSLIFLLLWKWMIFDLLKKYVLWLLSLQLKLISPYEKGWNLNGGQGYKRHISFSTHWHGNIRFLGSDILSTYEPHAFYGLPFIYWPIWCDVCELPPSPSNVISFRTLA